MVILKGAVYSSHNELETQNIIASPGIYAITSFFDLVLHILYRHFG